MLEDIKRLKTLIWLGIVAALLSGCAGDSMAGYTKYSYEFLGSFDTVIQFIGYAKSQDDLEAMAKSGETRFMELHRLFDIYNTYDGINNIKTINDNAGIKPVRVSQEIIDLVQFSKEWHDKSSGTVSIALGPVLSIWHEYRERGLENPEGARLPPMEKLIEARKHCDISKIIVDPDAHTVFLPEKNMSIDVGAVAKGFAVEIVAKELQEQGYSSFLISAGGNVKVVGRPMDITRLKWGIGILDPGGDMQNQEGSTLDTLYINQGSAVTSGDYQRYYTVDGRMYHHLIDPETLMPASYYRSVTVYAMDSAEADFLSTTLFLLPYEKSRKLADDMEGIEALWVFPDGSIQATEGMKSMLKVLGGATNK